jgi:hypothetical protein
MAKEHAETALLTLVEIADGEAPASARVSAAIAILDRAYGKPPQALEHSASVEDGVLNRVMAEVFGGKSFEPKSADELSGERNAM